MPSRMVIFCQILRLKLVVKSSISSTADTAWSTAHTGAWTGGTGLFTGETGLAGGATAHTGATATGP